MIEFDAWHLDVIRTAVVPICKRAEKHHRPAFKHFEIALIDERTAECRATDGHRLFIYTFATATDSTQLRPARFHWKGIPRVTKATQHDRVMCSDVVGLSLGGDTMANVHGVELPDWHDIERACETVVGDPLQTTMYEPEYLKHAGLVMGTLYRWACNVYPKRGSTISMEMRWPRTDLEPMRWRTANRPGMDKFDARLWVMPKMT